MQIQKKSASLTSSEVPIKMTCSATSPVSIYVKKKKKSESDQASVSVLEIQRIEELENDTLGAIQSASCGNGKFYRTSD